MGSTITRKTSDHAIAPGDALLDPAGAPAPLAPLLLEWRPAPPAFAHGRAPSVDLGAAPALLPRGLADLGPAAVLRASGPEREGWVQGVQTADVRAVPRGGALPTLFLNARGRTLGEGLLWRTPAALLAQVPPARLEALRAHLDALLIMEDAELSVAPGLRRLRLCATGAEEQLAALTPAQRDLFAEVRGAPTPLGFELLLEEAPAAALLAAFPQRPDAEALERERLWLGVPSFPQDFDEASTPLEAGLTARIAFGKGCYVGQEVIAMATYRGRVPWSLARLEVDGPAPAPGTPLDPSRGPKGRVTSAAQIGEQALLLGLVHHERLEPGAAIPLGDGRTARVLGPPQGATDKDG